MARTALLLFLTFQCFHDPITQGENVSLDNREYLLLIYFQTTLQRTAQSISAVQTTFKKSNVLNQDLPEECLKLGFCDKAQHYPVELAEKLIKELFESNMSLDNDVNEINETMTISLENRFGDFDITLEDLCKFEAKTIKPIYVRNDLDGNWYYTLNSDTYSVQLFDVKVCASNHGTGYSDMNCVNNLILKDDYHSQCIQKYVTRSILVIDNNNIRTIPFDIPACCSCVAIKNDD